MLVYRRVCLKYKYILTSALLLNAFLFMLTRLSCYLGTNIFPPKLFFVLFVLFPFFQGGKIRYVSSLKRVYDVALSCRIYSYFHWPFRLMIPPPGPRKRGEPPIGVIGSVTREFLCGKTLHQWPGTTWSMVLCPDANFSIRKNNLLLSIILVV